MQDGRDTVGWDAGRPASRPLSLPVRDLERAVALVGDKDAIRLLAGLLDAREVAALWGVSVDFVEDLGRRGALPWVKIGRLVKYRVLDVVKCVERHAGLPRTRRRRKPPENPAP